MKANIFDAKHNEASNPKQVVGVGPATPATAAQGSEESGGAGAAGHSDTRRVLCVGAGRDDASAQLGGCHD